MQRTNFQLADLIYLQQGDQKYDLHNNYNFRRVQYDCPSQGLTLRWEGGLWRQPVRLELRFSKVDHFSVQARDPEMPYSEDVTLESMGYLAPEDLNELEWVGEEQHATDQSFLVFSFRGGQKIVVRSERVSLEVSDESTEA